MTPATIIADAKADGVVLSLTPDGRLAFKGPRHATDKWVPLLQNAKQALLAHLSRTQRKSWGAVDWQAYFDERAAVLEYDAGLPRPEAEAQAFRAAVVEWVNRHPVRSDPGRCHWCGETGAMQPLLPFLASTRHHAWGHASCWPSWCAARKAEAVKVLEAFGLKSKAGARA